MEIRSIQIPNDCLMPDYDVQAQIEETYKNFRTLVQTNHVKGQRGKDKGGKKGKTRTRTTMEKGITMGSKTKH
eukprot:5546423-Ditylum_brightwellii.AAC.1